MWILIVLDEETSIKGAKIPKISAEFGAETLKLNVFLFVIFLCVFIFFNSLTSLKGNATDLWSVVLFLCVVSLFYFVIKYSVFIWYNII